MKIKIALIVAAALIAALYGVKNLADARSFQLFGNLVHRVDTEKPWVALTFDDGPTPEATERILAILARNEVPATFFFTGAELAANPGLAEKYVAAGHELGNHTYSHRRMLLRSPMFIRHEIEDTDALIRASGYEGPIYFRPRTGRSWWDCLGISPAPIGKPSCGMLNRSHIRKSRAVRSTS
ncbi:polysaccharide deacetylase family protein [Alkalilimnicola ehrlichii]|uniref:polysaccharide deacetylase family protein n=1 Tax=Alkalilimnicola ehrlichii TaxID=351052 RepID=UPI001C6F30C0